MSPWLGTFSRGVMVMLDYYADARRVMAHVTSFLLLLVFFYSLCFSAFFILVLCSASQVVTSLAAMALPNWRHLELGLGLVSISCSVIFHFFVAFCQISLATSAVWFFIPESPRWLIAQASRDKSSKNMKKLILTNCPLP